MHGFFTYSGQSMWPVFQEGDLLEVEPVLTDQLQRGDVIIFRNSEAVLVVHRVIAIRPGLKTRGDALSIPDCGEVIQQSLIGRVIRRYRLGMERNIVGGWTGLLSGKVHGLAGRIDPAKPSRGGAFARWLRIGFVTVLRKLPPAGQFRRVSLTNQSEVILWHWGDLAIGRRQLPSGEWFLYWPWRVFFSAPEINRSFNG